VKKQHSIVVLVEMSFEVLKPQKKGQIFCLGIHYMEHEFVSN